MPHTGSDIAEQWKRKIDADLVGWYLAETGPSRPFLHGMADLGFCTVMSQEGVVDADISERAAVFGWMSPAVVPLMWHHVNLTELVLVMQGRDIPITYSRHLLTADESPEMAAPYRKGGALHLEPFPGTYSDGWGSQRGRPPKPLPRDWVYTSIFDPKHGRPARKKLYPTVLRLLEVCRAALA